MAAFFEPDADCLFEDFETVLLVVAFASAEDARVLVLLSVDLLALGLALAAFLLDLLPAVFFFFAFFAGFLLLVPSPTRFAIVAIRPGLADSLFADFVDISFDFGTG